MKLTAQTNLCLIIGDPVAHSLSPQMHNAAYAHLGLENNYTFFSTHVPADKLANAIAKMRDLKLKGMTVTIPHKSTVMQYLDSLDETAQKIGAVNTIVNHDGTLKGYNTDWIGIITPLAKITTIQGKKVAVLGAGGAARSVVYALVTNGAQVTIFNRTLESAKKLAEDFLVSYAAINEYETIKDMDIIINATSVGLHPDTHLTPLPKEFISKKHIVFDAIYTPYNTQLLLDAKDKGATVIHGLEMLLYQGLAQFELYTGFEAPEKVMREILMQKTK